MSSRSTFAPAEGAPPLYEGQGGYPHRPAVGELLEATERASSMLRTDFEVALLMRVEHVGGDSAAIGPGHESSLYQASNAR